MRLTDVLRLVLNEVLDFVGVGADLARLSLACRWLWCACAPRLRSRSVLMLLDVQEFDAFRALAYDPATQRARPLAFPSCSAWYYGPSCALFGRSVLLLLPNDGVFRFNVDTQRWEPTSKVVTLNVSLVATENVAIVHGIAGGWRYRGKTWERLHLPSDLCRMTSVSGVLRDANGVSHLVIAGGFDEQALCWRSSVKAFDLDRAIVRNLAPLPVAGEFGSSLVFDNRLYTARLEESTIVVRCFDLRLNEWRLLPRLEPASADMQLGSPRLVAWQTRLIIMCVQNGSSTVSFELSDDCWLRSPVMEGFPSRCLVHFNAMALQVPLAAIDHRARHPSRILPPSPFAYPSANTL